MVMIIDIFIKDRVMNEAIHIINNNSNIRELAKIFKVSKSTVSIDLSKRLKKYNNKIYDEVMNILDEHKKIKHINGGLATKLKYSTKAKEKL